MVDILSLQLVGKCGRFLFVLSSPSLELTLNTKAFANYGKAFSTDTSRPFIFLFTFFFNNESSVAYLLRKKLLRSFYLC
jgi:hypothetical protein